MSIFNLTFIWFLILLHLTQLASNINRPNIIIILTDDQVTLSKLELKRMVCEDFTITEKAKPPIPYDLCVGISILHLLPMYLDTFLCT